MALYVPRRLAQRLSAYCAESPPLIAHQYVGFVGKLQPVRLDATMLAFPVCEYELPVRSAVREAGLSLEGFGEVEAADIHAYTGMI